MNESPGVSDAASSPRPPSGASATRAALSRSNGLPGAVKRVFLVLLTLCGLIAVVLITREPTQAVQRGQRGTAMLQVYSPAAVATARDANFIPEPEAQEPPDPEAPPIEEVFENVQVLNDLTVLEFSRLMQAMSTWVAPEQGCEFCHNPDNLASDEKYTKVVARKMLTMTRRINTEWKQHVAGTGVTCWTCHRGQAVPSGDWFARPNFTDGNMIGRRAANNGAGVKTVGNAALPADPLSTYLVTDEPIRIQGTQALAAQQHDSILQARSTYGLMMYMSQSLGVNCTYCHNTRALARWDQSTQQRVTAWYGIRMVRDLNNSVIVPLKPLLPVHRLSAEGDTPKLGCETCHKGSYKPLLGVSMLTDYPELAGVMLRPEGAASAPAAAKDAAAAAALKTADAAAAPR